MSITTERKNLNLNKCSINESISSWIEQDIIVPDTKPDAIKIISATVNAYASECEALDDRVKVTGKLNYYIIYRCNEENMQTRGLCVTFPYTQVLQVKGATRNMEMYVMPFVKNVIHSLPNERKIATKTEVMFNVMLKAPASISLITKFQCDHCIESKTKKDKFSHIMKYKSNIIASKEDIMMAKENDDFFEILKAEAVIKNTEYKESYNKLMVKGDLDVALLYLSEKEEEQIKTASIMVPFTGMIEMDGISDKSNFDIKYMLQDFNIRPNMEITSTKTLTIEYQIEAMVTMFEKIEIEYINDFYSQTRDLDYDDDLVDVVKNEEVFVRNIDVKETVRNILTDNTRLIEYTVDTSYITPKVMGNVIHIEGNLKVTFMTINEMSRNVETKIVDILINEEYVIDEIGNESQATVMISIDKSMVSTVGEDIDTKITVRSVVNVENTAKLDIIDNITEKDIEMLDLDSMNIYIVKQGDTLWSIAKRYKTSVEKIVSINDITDPNVIDIGQKILIIR